MVTLLLSNNAKSEMGVSHVYIDKVSDFDFTRLYLLSLNSLTLENVFFN